jgi:hypothetical protein
MRTASLKGASCSTNWVWYALIIFDSSATTTEMRTDEPDFGHAIHGEYGVARPWPITKHRGGHAMDHRPEDGSLGPQISGPREGEVSVLTN